MHFSVFIFSKMHGSIWCWVGKCKKRINVYTAFRNKNVNISRLIIFDSCHSLHHIFASFLFNYWYSTQVYSCNPIDGFTNYIYIHIYIWLTIKLRTMENDYMVTVWLQFWTSLLYTSALKRKQWLFNESCFKRIV